MERRGPFHNFSGPRLPAGPQEGDSTESLADPGKGEKLTRCLTCGSARPAITGSFMPDTGQKFAGRIFRYRLCSHCIEYANGPQNPDPLHVSEEAA